MTDQRGRGAAIGLAALLAVLLAAVTIVVVLSPASPSPSPRLSASVTAGGPVSPSPSPSASASPSSVASPDPSAGPSPSPSAVATRTPRPSRRPNASPTDEPTRTPRRSREPTASAVPPPTDGPSASPLPTGTPVTAAEASIRFVDMGLDSPVAETPRRRLFTIRSQGAGTVRATVSDVSAGRVRLCLWRGDPDTVQDQQCRDMSGGSLSATASGAGTSWTVSALTAEGVDVPTVDLTLTFPSTAPSVTIDGFRFQGTAFPEYNGFSAIARVGEGGTLALSARWRGGAQPFSLRVEEAASGATVDERTGDGESVDHGSPLAGPGSYRVRLQNEVEVAEQDFLLSGTIEWPGG